jgi:hypothetical protein
MEIIRPVPMPPKVAAAICAVMGSVPKLARSERNTHGNYNFASIDDFLEAVRPMCAKHGLVILQDQIGDHEIAEGGVYKFGKPRRWMKLTYSFLLVHSSGETWEHPMTRSIVVEATMGSQSFGAAQSYTLKLFLRSLFQISTGEKDDVDHQPNEELPPPPPRPTATPPPRAENKREALVTKEEAISLWELIEETGADAKKFIEFFNVKSVNLMPASRYRDALAMLQKKRKQAKEHITEDGEILEPFEHPERVAGEWIDRLAQLPNEREIRDYATDVRMFEHIEAGHFDRTRSGFIEDAYNRAMARLQKDKDAPPDPFAQ